MVGCSTSCYFPSILSTTTKFKASKSVFLRLAGNLLFFLRFKGLAA